MKLALLPLLAVLTFILMSCNEQKELSFEMIAFNSLSMEKQDLIPVSPKDSIVEKITVRDEIKPYLDPDYEEDQVYAVTFKNTKTDSNGELTVFVSSDRKTVVGKGRIDR